MSQTQSASKSPISRTQTAKARARLRKIEARCQAEAQAEERAEAIAPAAQRHAVAMSDGTVIRGPRLVRDGVTFRVASPLCDMVVRGKKRVDAGLTPTVSAIHLKAANRLMIAWESGGSGVNVPAAPYGDRVSGGGAGYGMMALLATQRAARRECEIIATHLGALWPCVRRIAIEGADVSVWAAETGRDPVAASGYLSAALDMLARVYDRLDAVAKGETRAA